MAPLALKTEHLSALLGKRETLAGDHAAGKFSASRRLLITSAKIASAVIVCLLLGRQLGGVDFSQVGELLSSVGWKMCLVLIPAAAAVLSDTTGWAACITKGSPGRLTTMIVPLRIGCDALTNSLPAGAAAAETARPILLHRRCGLDMPEAIASCLLAKLNMAVAQIIFILGVIAPALACGSFGTARGVVWMLAVGALAFLPVLAAMALVYSGPRLRQTSALLAKIPWAWLRTLLERVRPDLERIDRYAQTFAASHKRRLALSLGAFLAGWITSASESFVILALLGAGASLAQALTMEVVASILRIAFFFIPSALGAAEIGYATLIASFGSADPVLVSAAFIAIKRSRELLWIALGYLALAFSARSHASSRGRTGFIRRRWASAPGDNALR
ncbi:MAG TPA: lysylphosphatidylglycerol synthase domain-containing protein [Bacteroidota bacterium]|nr:lysylphosphatidylglycerol synthase domain-containing protein [Bacteroidota bacterium]